MIFVFYFFAAFQVFLGYKSLRGGIEYLKFFKLKTAEPESDFTPFVSVIAPCRGLDADLESNLTALFRQNFPRYEIVFAVDSEMDEAVSIIKKIIEREANGISKSAKLVVAGQAVDSSQKVHNLRRAILEVSERSEVFAFVDSDARPDKDWLRNLIAPLENKQSGAATGYRWFIAGRGGFAAQLHSVWNASIASALGDEKKSNFCWGGSTAMRRDTFERLDIAEKWRGALSDDYAVTRAMKEANLPVYFVPQALTASIEDYSFRQVVEFTTRQMKITRVYAPHLWIASFVGSFLFSVVFWTGVLLLFFASGWQFWLTLLFLPVIFALGAAKAWIRLNAVKLVLKDYEKQLNQSFWWQITLWTISPVLFFYNDLAALVSRKIIWRGIEYRLKSTSETVIISRNEK